MNSRAEILAETLARLEVERYAPRPPLPADATSDGPSLHLGNEHAEVSVEQGMANQRILLAALGGEVTYRDALCDRGSGVSHGTIGTQVKTAPRSRSVNCGSDPQGLATADRSDD